MRQRGFDVTVIASPGKELDRVAEREGVRTIGVSMERPVRPWKDTVSLAALGTVLRSLQPDIVDASTPKAGLLGMVAACALRVPLRIYLLRGLRLETAHGALRKVLATTERIASRCAHEVVCNSKSLRERVVSQGLVPESKALVLGEGSSGVDVERWTATTERKREGQRLLGAAGIREGDEIIGFIGRFDPDKGIEDLLEAFVRVKTARPRARLLLIGGGHAGDWHPRLAQRMQGMQGVVALPSTDELAPYYAAMHVLAFPSLREGFPNVPLEAACAGVPAVGYRSTGVVDAIADGETGTIVPQRDVAALADAVLRYLCDPTLRDAHGKAARLRAENQFSRSIVLERWASHYRGRLAEVSRGRWGASR